MRDGSTYCDSGWVTGSSVVGRYWVVGIARISSTRREPAATGSGGSSETRPKGVATVDQKEGRQGRWVGVEVNRSFP